MNVLQLLREHEGCELTIYRCPAGKLTIGVGHNLEANPISEAAAAQILEDDVRAMRNCLTEKLPWFVALDEIRQAALIDLVFNLGWSGLSKFVKFLAAMGRSDWPRAGDELRNSAWHQQVGRRAPRIESMIERGEWP